MKIKFKKMHGCGNDYIYIDCFEQTISNPGELSVKLSDRNFGIGGDGIILVSPSEVADGQMRIFNSDGSEARMCGNGIRCAGKLLYDNNHLIGKPSTISIDTPGGVKTLEPTYCGNEISSLKVDMGRAAFDPALIPVNLSLLECGDCDKIVSMPFSFGDICVNITCVSMGNPHCVVFCDSVDDIDIEKAGPLFENSPLFPDRVNTEFVKVLSGNSIRMRVWERGSGETLACGTGACASVVAACENNLCAKGEDVAVNLKGGELTVRYTGDTVLMSGEAVSVFSGEIEI